MQGAAEIGDARPAGGSVLWRHVAAAAAQRAAAEAKAGALDPVPPLARTPERVIAGAIGRAADRVHGLRLFFDRVEFGRVAPAELSELFPERALISVVEGPAEALGVVAICPGLLGSVIEMQATGRISARAPSARRATRTDGLICADFINACLAELGNELASLPGHEGLRGYRYASFLDDPRPLELMLDDGNFHLVQLRLRAGEAGQRDGRILIALPARPEPVAGPALPPRGAEAEPLDEGATDAVTLAGAVRAAPIDLAGILCRRMISLGELRALAPGDMIALPSGVLGSATLETAAGQVLFRGKLGELAGRHALRLAREDARLPALSAFSGTEAETLPDAPAEPGLHEPPIADLDTPDSFRPCKAPEPSLPAGDAVGAAPSAGNGRV